MQPAGTSSELQDERRIDVSRLVWSAAGERFFESGLDRGVLYVSGIGVAWSGLISIDESPTGGDAKAFYHDGIKYLNLAAAEEFEATINAYSSPPQFGPCDGVGAVYNGLFATQQPRKPFSLSYRTKVGNDTDGPDHAYKIHLVYNALAAPTSRSHASLSDNMEVASLSWHITTLPPGISGYRPTAHFVVDTRSTPADVLAELEDKLYGNQSFNASLPTVAELLTMFGVETLDAQFPASPTDVVLDGGTP
jgi:hypothetical protein